MLDLRKKLVFTALVLVTAVSLSGMSNSQKINMLLEMMENSNLVFIRNGVEYPASKAREHLEMKLRRAGTRIRTVDDFIEYIASKSSWSGKEYYVKYPDGKKVKAGSWLRMKLKKINRKDKK